MTTVRAAIEDLDRWDPKPGQPTGMIENAYGMYLNRTEVLNAVEDLVAAAVEVSDALGETEMTMHGAEAWRTTSSAGSTESPNDVLDGPQGLHRRDLRGSGSDDAHRWRGLVRRRDERDRRLRRASRRHESSHLEQGIFHRTHRMGQRHQDAPGALSMTYNGWWRPRPTAPPRPREHLMTWTKDDVRRLQDKVRRIAETVAKPFRATGRFPSVDPSIPETGPIMEESYAELIARGEAQAWTKADEDDLAAKVRKIRG